MKHIFICPQCKFYTLKAVCPHCPDQIKTISPQPPKYSPTDKYGSYRRKEKKKELKQKKLY